jgi:hypothetical protein
MIDMTQAEFYQWSGLALLSSSCAWCASCLNRFLAFLRPSEQKRGLAGFANTPSAGSDLRGKKPGKGSYFGAHG